MAVVERLFYIPNPLEMHRTNFDNVSDFFGLEDTVSAASGHAGDIEQFRSVHHMVI